MHQDPDSILLIKWLTAWLHILLADTLHVGLPTTMVELPQTDNSSFDAQSTHESCPDSPRSSETSFIVKTPTMRFDATPSAPVDDQPVVGIIGMGEMGKMYAKTLSAAGWAK